MEFILYKMSKRENSTKLPVLDENSIRVNGKIIDSNSQVVNPVISLPRYKNGIETEYIKFNYIGIPKFQRFYWVRDWNINNDGTVTAYCICDYLASFRANILQMDAFVTRTNEPSLYDRFIIDPHCKGSTHVESYSVGNTFADWLTNNPENSIFVLGVISGDNPKYGALNYYVLPADEFNVFVANMVSLNSEGLFTDPNEWKTSTLGGEILKSIVSPLSYIRSCKWFPVKTSVMGQIAEYSDIYCGPWNSGAKGIKLDVDNMYIDFKNFFVLPYPSTYESSNSLYGSFITTYIYNSLFGTIQIPSNIVTKRYYNTTQYNHNVNFKISINLVNGNGVLKLYDTKIGDPELYDYKCFAVNETVMSVDIPIADVSYNYVGMTKSLVNGAAGVASAAVGALNPTSWGSAISAGAQAVNSAIDAVNYSIAPNATAVGGANQAFTKDVNTFLVVGLYTTPIDRDINHFGLPCCRRIQFPITSLHSGPVYIEAVDCHISLNINGVTMLKDEYDILIDLLRMGVYLE